jgi:hypothetical protein
VSAGVSSRRYLRSFASKVGASAGSASNHTRAMPSAASPEFRTISCARWCHAPVENVQVPSPSSVP